MERYFFDVLEDKKLYVDSEGTELEDADAALDEAAQALTEYAHDVLPSSRNKHLTMTIRDASGRSYFELDLQFNVRTMAMDG